MSASRTLRVTCITAEQPLDLDGSGDATVTDRGAEVKIKLPAR